MKPVVAEYVAEELIGIFARVDQDSVGNLDRSRFKFFIVRATVSVNKKLTLGSITTKHMFHTCLFLSLALKYPRFYDTMNQSFLSVPIVH